MFRVLVVDDEPLALKSICSIIERRSKEYKVIATAENGQDALKKIRTLVPELVICDIKMPLISGVELATIIRNELPEVCFILASGYQDFEYARSAIRSGVTDYLLKPIIPSDLLQSLEYASERIEEIRYKERNRILRALGNGKMVDRQKVKRYFPSEQYYGVLLRLNGLPRRFSMDRTREIYSDIYEKYVLFGRDEMESLYLIPQELLPKEGFLSYLDKIRSQQKPTDYYTLIYDSRPFSSDELREKIQSMYQELDQRSSVGVTQCLDLSELEKNPVLPPNKLRRQEECILSRLETVAKTKKSDQIREEIRAGYQAVKSFSPPQLWLENFTREILIVMRQNGLCRLSASESEHLLNDAFYNATSMEMLADTLMDIFFDGEKDEPGNSKVDSREFFNEIEHFLELNLSKSLTLSELCREFGISQTYMSRLFRKYTGNSFSQYLTEMRMNRAKELFRANPDSFIKDVAAMVGYEDQFYFSRIFRSYTKKSPSEYLKEISKLKMN